jgi:hypothetical protein
LNAVSVSDGEKGLHILSGFQKEYQHLPDLRFDCW